MSKGSWRRPTDREHTYKEVLQNDDFGRVGCKNGVGAFHPMRSGHCIYCGNDLAAIKRLRTQADKEKEQ